MGTTSFTTASETNRCGFAFKSVAPTTKNIGTNNGGLFFSNDTLLFMAVL